MTHDCPLFLSGTLEELNLLKFLVPLLHFPGKQGASERWYNGTYTENVQRNARLLHVSSIWKRNSQQTSEKVERERFEEGG